MGHGENKEGWVIQNEFVQSNEILLESVREYWFFDSEVFGWALSSCQESKTAS